MWLPDTNVWIKVINPQHSLAKQRFHRCHPQQLVMCDVVKSELYYGAYKSQRPLANVSLIDELSQQFRPLSFDAKAAKILGQIRADLEKRGQLIGAYDMQIAAIALAHDCIVVTHNTKEFERITELRLEDWEV